MKPEYILFIICCIFAFFVFINKKKLMQRAEETGKKQGEKLLNTHIKRAYEFSDEELIQELELAKKHKKTTLDQIKITAAIVVSKKRSSSELRNLAEHIESSF